MEPGEFAEFYERYWERCIRAGVEPLTPEAKQALITQWEFLGLSWDSEPHEAGSDGNKPQHPKH
jgi:hypothetical protein